MYLFELNFFYIYTFLYIFYISIFLHYIFLPFSLIYRFFDIVLISLHGNAFVDMRVSID